MEKGIGTSFCTHRKWNKKFTAPKNVKNDFDSSIYIGKK